MSVFSPRRPSGAAAPQPPQRRAVLATALAVCGLALGLGGLSGCASGRFAHQMPGFHDEALLQGAKPVEVRPSFAAGLTGGAIEAVGQLNARGVLVWQYDSSRSSGPDAYRQVRVASREAPNLRWEVWTRTDGAVSLGARQYAKILGPFRNGEEIRLPFVNNNIGQSLERSLLLVVYSPTETERAVQLGMSEVRR